MTGRTLTPVTNIFLISLYLLLLNCAEVAPPPGGDEDKRPPVVVETSPVNGAINVQKGREITFWFSEGIIRPSTVRPVFISPRQDNAPRLKWKSDQLVIKLANDFEPNRTYVVTVTSDVTDWRRNKMDSTMTIAFSTGDKIDSGAVSGYVTNQGNPKSGILVGLFEMPAGTSDIKYDSVFPSYVTPSAADGSFRFRFLPAKEFRMVAFEDINQNEKFNYKEESFAVPDRPINTGGVLPLKELYLEMSTPVGEVPKAVSALYTSDKLIRIRFDSELPLGYLKDRPREIDFLSKIDTNKVYEANSFMESHLETSPMLTVCSQPLDTGTYIISIKYDSAAQPIRFDGVSISDAKDKASPSIISFTPDNKPHFLKDIRISAVFSEPIDKSKLTAGTFSMMDEEEHPVILTTRWTDAFHLSVSADSLQQGKKYQMNMAEFEIADLAGNLLGDSIQTYSFSILNNDSLGSVSGNLVVDLADKGKGPKQLTFKDISGKQSFDLRVPGNSFNAELPAGKYLLSGYLDDNNNSKRDKGSVLPYSFAETFGKLADTISVRARFETAGIEFKFK